ncbi:alpha/beta hydrolase [Azorhizobium oxalatiphilum]|uniref:Alpha/beta hydrolase n=1 Tax=Azorhizobium oxalatiphilum TaxID=980631 RepID=A0A917BK45_9HYPH|nr:alpha/beta hydrolase [Azorhizobium oxalatiphilum]GGF44902.1 alpha/beta hydrolase [Azorhizobium oxalatiphilum]
MTVDVRFLAYPSADGLALFARQWGEPQPRLPVVLLPGLTRNSRDFEALAEALSQHPETPRQVIGFDFRGRGGSAYGPVSTYTPLQEAQDTLRGLAALGISRAIFLGTSRGGLVMLTLALLKRVDLFAGAIFNDIGPVIEPAGLARIAGYVGKPVPEDWPGMVAELKATQGFLFPGLSDEEWERYARQIYRDDAGRPRLAYDPALEEAFRAFDPAKPLPDLWPAFEAFADVPTMVVHGALSDILSEASVTEMAARHPGLIVHRVEDQGHAPLLWDAATQEALRTFMDGIG